MKINGEEQTLDQAVTLLTFLLERDYNPERIVVEKNREIVPKDQYAVLILENADDINILHFVGGG